MASPSRRQLIRHLFVRLMGMEFNLEAYALKALRLLQFGHDPSPKALGYMELWQCVCLASAISAI